MKRTLLLLFVALHAVAAVPKDAEIRKILVDRIDIQHQGVGIVVGVIEPQGRRIVAYGTFDKNDKRPVNGDTFFEIGSVSKVFTSLLLADAVQRGEVALTDPVSKFLPPTVKAPAITLEELATHRSGLPRLPSNLMPKDAANPYADYTVQQLYDFLSGYTLPRDPGAQYEYSNLGAGLLGHVLTLRTGRDYATLLKTRIAVPLELKNTLITLTEAQKKRLAPGHDEQQTKVANWDLPTLAGAGAIRSTANDLLTFIGAHLGYARTPLTPAMTAMLANRYETGTPGLAIALGWHVLTTSSGREIVWHNGGTGGYRSFIGFDPKTRAGVVVLANMSSPDGVDDLGRRLLDPDPPRAATDLVVAPATLERYTGNYQLAPNFILAITRENNHLFLQATGQPRFELFAKSEKEFFLKVVDARVTFEDDGLILHQNGMDQKAKRFAGPPPAPKVRKEITLDPAILGRYVGKYQLAPTFIINITHEGDSLYLQATAQPKFPLFAESEREFFLKVVDAQVTFEDDALILHQNGAHQRAPKMK
ncbi:MAG: serine hydrolase [Acidobacteriota bacterium]